jgi:hypothetical protein
MTEFTAESREWLLLNAVECWLYHFPDHGWTPEYKALAAQLKQQLEAIESKSQSQKRTPKATKPQD